jgi:serine/threonine protein kinase
MDEEPNAISFSEEFSFEAGSDSFYSATTPSFTEEGKPLMNNQYEQIRQIGQGSFGTVYLVLDQKDKENRQYALKEVICHDEQDLNKYLRYELTHT